MGENEEAQMATQKTVEDAEMTVTDIGGIEDTSVTFEPGATILTGRNATNRTSLLLALNEALGGSLGNVRAGADTGSVELTMDGETYTRTINADTNARNGNPYLRDEDTPQNNAKDRINTFVTLLETNPIREIIERWGRGNEVGNPEELYDVIDTAGGISGLQDQIDSLKEKENELQSELDRKNDRRGDLPGLEEERNDLIDKIADLEEQIEDIEQEIEEEREKESEQEDEVEATLDDLKEKRNQLNKKENQLENERVTLEKTETRIEDAKEELTELREDVGDVDKDTLQTRISTLQDDKQELKTELSKINDLRNAVQDFMEADSHILHQLAEETTTSDNNDDDGDVTDQLVEDTVKCGVCGTVVPIDRMEEQKQALDDLRTEKTNRLSKIEDDLDELQEKLNSFEKKENEIQEKENMLERNVESIETTEDNIEEFEKQIETLEDEIDQLEEVVEENTTEENSDSIDLQKKRTNIEVELRQAEDDLENTEDEIEEVKELKPEVDELEDEIQSISSERKELRQRQSEIQKEVTEEFNTRIKEVLNLLEYENIAVIRMEYKSIGGTNQYDLEVTRPGEGTTAMSTLSESEREVIGLVIALAAYLVFEIQEDVPFILLDSLEAIDAERIDAILNYFQEETGYIVAALLEEDANALDTDFHRIQSKALQTA